MAWCRMLRGMSGLDLASLGIPGDTEYLSEYCSNTNIGGGNSLQKMNKKNFLKIAEKFEICHLQDPSESCI